MKATILDLKTGRGTANWQDYTVTIDFAGKQIDLYFSLKRDKDNPNLVCNSIIKEIDCKVEMTKESFKTLYDGEKHHALYIENLSSDIKAYRMFLFQAFMYTLGFISISDYFKD